MKYSSLFFCLLNLFVVASNHVHANLIEEQSSSDIEVQRAKALYEMDRARFCDDLEQADKHLELFISESLGKEIYGQSFSEFAQEALQPLAQLIQENKKRYLVATTDSLSGLSGTVLDPAASVVNDIMVVQQAALDAMSVMDDLVATLKAAQNTFKVSIPGLIAPAFLS